MVRERNFMENRHGGKSIAPVGSYRMTRHRRPQPEDKSPDEEELDAGRKHGAKRIVPDHLSI
jgi:hypothetical protein